jgi:hypothetical protein
MMMMNVAMIIEEPQLRENRDAKREGGKKKPPREKRERNNLGSAEERESRTQREVYRGSKKKKDRRGQANGGRPRRSGFLQGELSCVIDQLLACVHRSAGSIAADVDWRRRKEGKKRKKAGKKRRQRRAPQSD